MLRFLAVSRFSGPPLSEQHLLSERLCEHYACTDTSTWRGCDRVFSKYVYCILLRFLSIQMSTKVLFSQQYRISFPIYSEVLQGILQVLGAGSVPHKGSRSQNLSVSSVAVLERNTLPPKFTVIDARCRNDCA